MGRRRKKQVTVVIGAAMKAELLPLVRRLGLVRRGGEGTMWEGQAGKRRIVAGVSGVGGGRAAAAAGRWIDEHRADSLIWIGFCGGVNEKLPCGLVLAVSWLIDDAGTTMALGRSLPRAVPADDRPRDELAILHRDKPVCRVSEKRAIRQRYAAAGVDMESLPVARVALERRIGLRVYRAVLDDAKTSLPPDAADWVTADGRADARAAMMYLALRPWKVFKLLSLARKSRKAGRRLAEAVDKVEFQPQALYLEEVHLYSLPPGLKERH